MNIDPGIDEIFVDEDRLNQVLLNLYLNSIDASGEGGTLSVDVSTSDDPARIRITVSDTGTGIRKEDLQHVFDPYFTTKQTGTGLGLAIVREKVEKLVLCSSQCGGSRFIPPSPSFD